MDLVSSFVFGHLFTQRWNISIHSWCETSAYSFLKSFCVICLCLPLIPFYNHSFESFPLYIILTWREKQSCSAFLLCILFLHCETMHFVLRQFLPRSFNRQWGENSSVAAGHSKEKAKQTAGLCSAPFGNEGTNPIKDMHIFYLNFQKLHHRTQTAFRVSILEMGWFQDWHYTLSKKWSEVIRLII